MTVREVVETPVRFPALDGYDLGGTTYVPAGFDEPAIVIVFSAGGGVAAARYTRLARYLAAHGYPVLTYDYRGIGVSRPKNLRQLHVGVEDWSECDCGGAIAHLRSLYPSAEIVGMAHSLGALLMGGAPNVADVSRFVFIGAHTGYYKDYLRRYQLPMALLWHGLMPVLTRAFGFFPARALRLGEDIPAGIALQWAARRSPDFRPESARDVARGRALLGRCANVAGNALVLEFADDAFATQAGTRRLLSIFPGLRTHRLRLTPAEAGMKKIGHFGFFRRQAEIVLWPRLIAFLRNTAVR